MAKIEQRVGQTPLSRSDLHGIVGEQDLNYAMGAPAVKKFHPCPLFGSMQSRGNMSEACESDMKKFCGGFVGSSDLKKKTLGDPKVRG
jgi:hypothetical protein